MISASHWLGIAILCAAPCIAQVFPPPTQLQKQRNSVGRLPHATTSPTAKLSDAPAVEVLPQAELDMWKQYALIPEYGHHIEIIEKDLGEVKDNISWLKGAAWAIGGALVVFGFFRKAIVHHLMQEAAAYGQPKAP
jgi:hypothetical protein